MRGVNRVMLIGALGADPELRYSTNGNPVTKLRVATNESWKDKQTGQRQERVEWHRVTLFGRLAEVAAEYLKKGRSVYIEGSLRTEKYTDKDGVERYTTDIIASDMQLLGGPGEAGEAGEAGAQRDQAPRRSAPQASSQRAPGRAQQQAAAPPRRVPVEAGDDLGDDVPY